MDVDELAREALNRYTALDFGWLRFPPYLLTWFHNVERQYGAEVQEQVAEQQASMPAFATLERTGERHVGGLDAYFYRAEPGASAFGIILRGEELVYVSLLGGVYRVPEAQRPGVLDLPYPADQLIGFAFMQALEEVGAEGPSWTIPRAGPMSIGIALDRDDFIQLEPPERARVVARCTEVARDAVRLFTGEERAATLRIVAKAPQPAEGEPMNIALDRSDLVALEQIELS